MCTACLSPRILPLIVYDDFIPFHENFFVLEQLLSDFFLWKILSTPFLLFKEFLTYKNECTATTCASYSYISRIEHSENFSCRNKYSSWQSSYLHQPAL